MGGRARADARRTIGAMARARRRPSRTAWSTHWAARARWSASAPRTAAKSGGRSRCDDLGGTEPNWGYCESVLLDGDLVLCTPGGDQGAIAALDKATGKVRWQATELDDDAHYSSIIRAEINGQPQYVQLLENAAGRPLAGRRPVALAVGISGPRGRDPHADRPRQQSVSPRPATAPAACWSRSAPTTKPTELYDDKARKLMKNHHGGVIRVGDYLYGHSDGVGWICMDFATGEQKWRETRGPRQGCDRLCRRHVLLPRRRRRRGRADRRLARRLARAWPLHARAANRRSAPTAARSGPTR